MTIMYHFTYFSFCDENNFIMKIMCHVYIFSFLYVENNLLSTYFPFYVMKIIAHVYIFTISYDDNNLPRLHMLTCFPFSVMKIIDNVYIFYF